MAVTRSNILPVRSEMDVVQVRTITRQWSAELGFSLVEQTKMVTAASEIARNTLQHGKGGEVTVEQLNDGLKKGLRGRFANYVPPVMEALGRAEVEHNPRNNRMRAL